MHVPDHTNKQVRKEFDQAQGSRPNDISKAPTGQTFPKR